MAEPEDPIRLVEERFRIAEEHMAAELERLKRYYLLYRASSMPEHYSVVTRSQYIVPLIYKTVETILPRIMSVVFSATPPIQSRYRVRPDDPDAQQRLSALDQLFDFHFDRKRFFWIVQGWIKESLIYGAAYLKVSWRQVKRTYTEMRTELNPDSLAEQSLVDVPVTRTDVVDDGIWLENVSPFDLFFAPEAAFPDPFAAKYVIHRSFQRRSRLIAMRDQGYYETFDEAALTGTDETAATSNVLQEAMNRASGTQPETDDPLVTVYEYWEDERVITEAEHRVLLRDEANPFGLPGRPKRKPFVACLDNYVPGQLFQIGEAEPLEHTQIEMSTLRRQRTDNNTMAINTGVIYNKDSDFDLEAWSLSRPAMAVGVRPGPQGSVTDSVMPIPRQEITGSSYREYDALDKDAQEIAGTLDYAVGNAPERRETATTVQLLQAAANARFDIKVRNYNDAMQQLGYMMFERWKQLLVRPVPIAIPRKAAMGVTYVQITRDSLPEYDSVDLCVPGSPAMLLKDQRNQKLLQYYQSLVQNPMYQANPMWQQAANQLLIIALKEAEIDGIESVIQMLEMPPMPPMPPPGSPPAPGLPSAPPPARPAGQPMLNENPLLIPSPRPQR